MGEIEKESFFERAISNISVAWREVAKSRSLGIGLAKRRLADPDRLHQLILDCLKARGGEVSARARAADLGRHYLQLAPEGRELFLNMLAKDFAVDGDEVEAAIQRLHAAETFEEGLAAQKALRASLEPKRVKLLKQFNGLPESVKFLVDLRAELLSLMKGSPELRALDDDLHGLLTSWFDTGFLDLRRITWESSASLLEKLIAYEAVHAITSWDDLRNRLDSDRRCFALFHPRMPSEPLAFVEVALTKEIAGNVQALLDEQAPLDNPGDADTAIFYSISNTQKGLTGISFGEYLIKMAVAELSRELPGLKTFATLSPVPGFMNWLKTLGAAELEAFLSEVEIGGIRALGGDDDTAAALMEVLGRSDWHKDPVVLSALEEPLMRAAARYFLVKRSNGEPLDPVARFHLKNGARLERINWCGDLSAKGLKQSAGIMVNYRYNLADIEANHEDYVTHAKIIMSSEVRALCKSSGERTLSRLGLR